MNQKKRHLLSFKMTLLLEIDHLSAMSVFTRLTFSIIINTYIDIGTLLNNHTNQCTMDKYVLCVMWKEYYYSTLCMCNKQIINVMYVITDYFFFIKLALFSANLIHSALDFYRMYMYANEPNCFSISELNDVK
jgi:hypothetical protein